MLEYLYGKRFGSKTALANRKEGDRLRAGTSTETGCGPAPNLSPSFLLAKAVFEPNLFPYKYSNIIKASHLSYLSAYEDGTECSETSAYKIQTPRNYPDESMKQVVT
jgi:hypothetical protein